LNIEADYDSFEGSIVEIKNENWRHFIEKLTTLHE
jgi:hypothetical protein